MGSTGDNPNTDKTMLSLLNGTLSGISYRRVSSNEYDYTIVSGLYTNSSNLLAQLADGSMIVFYGESFTDCTLTIGDRVTTEGSSGVRIALTSCVAYIDVNGTTRPNKEVACAYGDTTQDPYNPCTVDNASMGDIFPVVFHDGTVEPATNAAAYVLNTAK